VGTGKLGNPKGCEVKLWHWEASGRLPHQVGRALGSLWGWDNFSWAVVSLSLEAWWAGQRDLPGHLVIFFRGTS
jgi:hypothetical protein